LEFRDQKENECKLKAEKMAEKVEYWIQEGKFSQTSIIGPVPCFYAKLNSIYRWQILVRGPNPILILRGKDLGDSIVTVDPVVLL
jgi:primosomal protein N' (replication factor Y)